MTYSKDNLLEVSIEKLKTLGFVNVTKSNIFKDEVYKYHFEIFMNSLKGQNEDMDRAIKTLVSSIDKKTNETH